MTVAEGVTINGKLELAVLVPSLTVTVMTATPVWPLAGVTVTVRLPPLPPNAMLPLGTSAMLAEVPDKVRLAAGVSRSLTVKPRAGAAVLMRVFVPGRREIVGGVLSGRTVTVKAVLLDLPPLSIT